MKKTIGDFYGEIGIILTLIGIVLAIPAIIKSFSETPDVVIGGILISKSTINISIFISFFFLFCALLIVISKIIKMRREAAKIIVAAAGNTIALSSILIEDCQKIIKTGQIDKIINKHNQRIIEYTDNTQIYIRDNIYKVIDEHFFEASLEALRNSSNKKQFEPIIAQAYNELAGLSTLENFIKGEFRDTLKEIKDFILRWLKDEDITKYLEINKDLQAQILELKNKYGSKFFFFINPELKDIITLDYEKEVIIAAALIPAFNILTTKVAASFGAATVASLGGVLASFGVDDVDFTTDTFTGDIHDEIGNQIASELFEYIGAAIPYIGFAFLALKAIRYFGIFKRLIDKPNKLREMREKIAFQLSQFIDSVCNKSTYEIEQSSFQLVSILKKRFIEIQSKSSIQFNRARKFI